MTSLVPPGEGAGRPLKRLIDSDLAKALESSGCGAEYVPPPLVVNADGFSLRTPATRIRKGQRAQLEKLCRYVTRPAISHERIDLTPNGHLDPTSIDTDIAFTSGELIALTFDERAAHMEQNPLAPTDWLHCVDGVSKQEPAQFATASPYACAPVGQATTLSHPLGRAAADHA